MVADDGRDRGRAALGANEVWQEVEFEALSYTLNAMRSAMRDELGNLLAEGGTMRCTMRSEVEAALQNWGGRSPGTQPAIRNESGDLLAKGGNMAADDGRARGRVALGANGIGQEVEFEALSYTINAMRSAMRDELGNLLAEGGTMRCTMRSEVEAALQNWGGQSPGPQPVIRDESGEFLAAMRRTMRSEVEAALRNWGGGSPGAQIAEPICPVPGKETSGDLEDADDAAELSPTPPEPRKSTHSLEAAGSEHFRNFVAAATSGLSAGVANDNDSVSTIDDVGFVYRVLRRVERVRRRMQDEEEPPREGRFAEFVTGKVFEAIVTVIIILNTLWMLYSADVHIRNPNHDNTMVFVVEWIFQTFFTIEMILRLSVHRVWFFFNASRFTNVFELGLLIAGFVTLGTAREHFPFGGALRVVRVLNIWRAARVFRVTTSFRPLHALMVCVQGSLSNLLWSLVLILMVYGIFSLFLVQIISFHLIDIGEDIETSIFQDSFGSIRKTMITLHKASTGGDDWGVAYELIQTTGGIGIALYLAFVIFMQLVVLNIITGIFVESALAVLRPDPETLARELCHQDRLHAEKLDRLCRAVDADGFGRLDREEFVDGLNKKHIPLLLKSLGLHRHHLVEFFDYMAEVQANDGQVDIETFVKGCMLLRGAASNFELHKLHAEIKANHAQLTQLLSSKPHARPSRSC